MHFTIDPHVAVPYAVIVAMLILVLGRAVSIKKVLIERMWMSPTFMVIAAAALLELSAGTLGVSGLMPLLAAFAAGGLLGWRRGRMTPVEIDPGTHELVSHISPGGAMVVVALFLARYFVHTLAVYEPKALFGGGPDTIGMLADGLVLFAVGMVATQRLELWTRCRRLLAETPAIG